MNKNWNKVSLLFFFLVALIGTTLRGTFLFSTPFQYAHLVHAHSHVAFQGWIYTILFLLLVNLYLSPEQIRKGHYPLQFKLTLPVLVGILIAFTLQGYALYSILFSTIFQLLNYWFIYRFLKDTKRNSDEGISLRFVKTGLWLGILSTLLPFAIGIASAKGLNGSEIYNSLIYTFLHLQYNGWFLFVAIGLFYKCLENDQVSYDQHQAKRFYLLFTWMVIPAICLSLLGMSYATKIEVPAYVAATLQLLGLVYFYKSISNIAGQWLSQKYSWVQYIVLIFLVCFGLKILLQSLTVFPFLRTFAFQNKPIMLAYLHLSLIGVITMLLLGLLVELRWIVNKFLSKMGLSLLIGGFVLTELLLALSGINVYSNHWLLFLGSGAMALGIFLLLINPVKSNPEFKG